jgi:hypothetical protein
MDANVIFGSIILAAWAALVLWGLGQTTLSAIRGHMWASNYLAGLAVGCVFGVGLVLFFKNSLPFDLIGAGFVLGAVGGLAIWAMGREARKLNDTLQTRALDILNEFIRVDLLTVSVSIRDPSTNVSCQVREARAPVRATKVEIYGELLTGKPIKGGPGIELILNRQFRLLADEEAGVRDALHRMTKPRKPNN